MNRKTFLRLAPLLVIGALAVSAVAAQAAPRILANGSETKLENGKKLPVMSWGTLKLENSKLGLITCKNAFGGLAEDPGVKGPGDLPGQGTVQGYAAYNCTGPLCEVAGEPVEVTPLGKATNPVTKAKETVGRITTPWETVVNEPEPGKWKLKVGNKVEASETKILFGVVCAAQALKAEFHGELNIAGEGGTVIGSAPAKLTFEKAATGELESTIGTGTVEGKVKLQGYEAQEVLTVVNQ